MTHINFTLGDCFHLFANQMTKITAFPLVLVLVAVYMVILCVNFKNKLMHIVVNMIHLFLVIYIVILYGKDIVMNMDTFFKGELLKNTYFYLFNMIISIVVMTNVLKSKKLEISIKYVCLVPYALILFFLLLMMLMSNIVNNNMLYIFGNTYPMVYFGNIISMLLYGFLIINWLFTGNKTRKHNFTDHRF